MSWSASSLRDAIRRNEVTLKSVVLDGYNNSLID